MHSDRTRVDRTDGGKPPGRADSRLDSLHPIPETEEAERISFANVEGGAQASSASKKIARDAEGGRATALDSSDRGSSKRLSVRSASYDYFNRGELDDTQQVIIRRDGDGSGRGYLRNEESYELVQEHLTVKQSISKFGMITLGLIVFAVILALSILGTSSGAATANTTGKLVSADRGGGREEMKEEETPPGGSGTAKPQTTTTIIVLGQSLNSDQSAPATLRSRVRTTAALVASATRHDAAAGCLLVLCGGDPAATGVAESEVMKSMLDVEFARLGVAPPTTLLDVWSRTTVGNALHAARLLKRRPGSDSGDVLLVSSEFHLPRALYFFEAVFAHAGLTRRIGARPALTPPPDAGGGAGGRGINSETLAQRIAGELRFAAKLDAQLEKHFGWERETLAAAGVLRGEMASYGPAPPLSAARKGQVRAELEAILLRR